MVPQLTITVDGKTLKLPTTPIRSTNTNGYTDQSHYQVYAPVKEQSIIKASASDPSVKIEISPIVAGRASVKATYKGQDKWYLIN